MKGFNKIVLGAAAAVAGAICLVAVAGVVKFNVLQDDIYYAQPDGTAIRANDIASETSPVFLCGDGTAGGVRFVDMNGDMPDRAFLAVDGTVTGLTRTASGPEEAYSSADGSVALSRKGESVSIKRDGTMLHGDCRLAARSWNSIFLMTLPDSDKKISLVATAGDGIADQPYRDEAERGKIDLYTAKLMAVSKVGTNRGETYVAAPFTVENQGSGLFWYIGLFRKDMDVFTLVDSRFLGDRIADVALTDQIQMVEVTFKDHAPGQPFSEPPARAKRLRFTASRTGLALDTTQ